MEAKGGRTDALDTWENPNFQDEKVLRNYFKEVIKLYFKTYDPYI